MEEKMRIAVVTSGGDAPGMNSCLKAIVDIASRKNIEIIAFKRGFNGLINDDWQKLEPKDVAFIFSVGGSLIYAGRCKEFQEESGKQKALATLKKHNIDSLIVLGGDGSMRGSEELSKYGINIYVIPVTIDNDVNCTDRSIGFDTAINNAINMIDNIKQTMLANERIVLVEVMGRYKGDIALYSALASESDIVVTAEQPFTKEQIKKAILKEINKGNPSPTVVISEKLFDVPALAKEIEKEFGKECRGIVLGYMQRGGGPTVYDRLLSLRMASCAVHCAVKRIKTSAICIDKGEVFPMPISKAIKAPLRVHKKHLALFDELHK